jgi:predicted RNA-binding protein Jag
MESFLSDLFDLQPVGEDASLEAAIREAEDAIRAVLNGERSVELSPASAYVRRLQHQMVRQAELISHSHGKEPRRRVKVLRS